MFLWVNKLDSIPTCLIYNLIHLPKVFAFPFPMRTTKFEVFPEKEEPFQKLDTSNS